MDYTDTELLISEITSTVCQSKISFESKYSKIFIQSTAMMMIHSILCLQYAFIISKHLLTNDIVIETAISIDWINNINILYYSDLNTLHVCIFHNMPQWIYAFKCSKWPNSRYELKRNSFTTYTSFTRWKSITANNKRTVLRDSIFHSEPLKRKRKTNNNSTCICILVYILLNKFDSIGKKFSCACQRKKKI